MTESGETGRIHAGAPPVDTEAVEGAELVEQARTTFLGGGGRQALRADPAPNLPRVMADERRIVQVLNNLLGNAARHSPGSSPIEVGAAREDAGVQAVRNFVRKLRRKPGDDPARPAFIHNARGVGYTMHKPGEA